MIFASILKAIGLPKPERESEIVRIVAVFRAANKEELIKQAIEINDREAHLKIIESLLYGAPGITRDPRDAQIWADAALKRKRKVQIAEYAEKLIPAAIASDEFLIKKKLGKTLALANSGDTKAQSKLADVLLAEGKKSRGEITYRVVSGGEVHFEGKGTVHYLRAMDWYAMARDAGAKDAKDKYYAVGAEMLSRGRAATTKQRGSPAERGTDKRENDVAPLPSRRSQEAATTSAPDFVTRRGIWSYTQRISFTRGYVEVLGGLLPKRGTIGADAEIRFDGCFPQRIGCSGSRTRFKTDGNLQVFYRKPEAVDKYIWVAKFVDTYNLF